MDKCIACGACSQRCPKKVPSEYNMGLDKRKAAHVMYAQAVPLKYAIDADNCLYFQKGKCRACQKFCPTGAVDFEQQPTQRDIQVGSLILATGFKPFDPSVYLQYSYANFTNVVTALEFERMLAASGPWLGHLVRPSDESEPKKVAWIQCVGSREINACDHPYCSSVCCMYAIKEAVIAKEHSKTELDAAVFFMDMRTFGKDFERYYEKAKHEGVRFIRSRIHSISEKPDNSLVIEYATEDGQAMQEEFDIVVLSQGLEIPQATAALCRHPGRGAEQHGLHPGRLLRPGVHQPARRLRLRRAGRAQGHPPVGDGGLGRRLRRGGQAPARGAAAWCRKRKCPRPRNVAGDTPRVGVFVCSCGINIAGVVDVAAVMPNTPGPCPTWPLWRTTCSPAPRTPRTRWPR